MATTDATHKGDRSIFLSLPAELRNAIYEYVFQSNTTRIVPSLREGIYSIKNTNSGLLYTSRQIRREAMSFFYSQTKIAARRTQDLRYWLGTLDPELRREVKRVHLDVRLSDEKNMTNERLETNRSFREGYLKAVLKGELGMPECEVVVRILGGERGKGEVLWPKDSEWRDTNIPLGSIR